MSKRKIIRQQARDTNDRVSRPSGGKMPTAMSKLGLTMDSFQNELARMGYGTPNMLEGTSYVQTRRTRDYNMLNTLYRDHWIIRNVIDTIPQDMTRNWITINTQLPPEQIRKVDKLWRTRQLKAKILHGLKWGRLYGGAGGLMLIEGHEDFLDQPLDFDYVMPGSLKGIMIIDRWSGLSPSSQLVEDINDVDFGLPESYEVALENGRLVQVHHSRLIRFVGRELPYWEKISEVYWGASEVEVVFDELKKRDNASWNIAQLIFLANLRVLKMKDLGQALAVGDAAAQQDLYNTVQMQNWLMSNFGVYVMDDADGFETHQYSFSGLSDIYENFMLDVAGACQTPVTKLFGRSPAGMNATGESDMQNYYETVQQSQESILSPVLDKILPVMFMSELGAIPDDLDYTYNPIRTPNDKDIADLVDKKATSINTLYASGIINQKIALKELKQMGESTGMFSNITDQDIEQAELTTAQPDADPFGLGGGGLFGESMGTPTTNRGLIPQVPPTRDGAVRRFLNWVKRSD